MAPKKKSGHVAIVDESKEQKIVVIDQDITPVQKSIEKFTKGAIKTPEDMEEATLAMSLINQVADKLKEDKEKLTEPLNALKAQIMSRYKPAESVLKPLIDLCRKRTSDYQTEQARIAREDAAKIAARVGEGKGKLKLETASKQMDAIEKPVEKVATSAGSLSFREDKVLKIENAPKIWAHVFGNSDYSFVDINEKELLKQLEAGKIVPGAVIDIVMSPINRRA